MNEQTPNQLDRSHTYAITRLALALFLLLATPVAFAGTSNSSPAATDPALIGAFDGRDLTQMFSSSFNTTPLALSSSLTSRPDAHSPAAEDLALNHVSTTLGSGSRLFSSRIPASPADSSSPSGSSGLAGMLALPLTGTSSSVGVDRPPLPPYGRRATWTFRVPLTRPG